MRVELVPLRIGQCRAPARASRGDQGFAPITFPAGAALIRHPRQGEILFDSGYGAGFWTATQSLPERLYRWATPAHLPAIERLPAQLQRLQAKPRLAILSHLHADHISGMFDLPACPPLLTSRAAWVAMAQGGRLATLKRGLPQPLRRALQDLPVPRFVEDAQPGPDLPGFAAFGPSYDLLGDGSLLAYLLPGHGHGQFGLLLPQTAQGAHFLIADAAWSRAALRDNALPPAAVLRRLGDAEAYRQTFAALRELMALRPDVSLWPAHCPEAYPAACPSPDPARQPAEGAA